PAPGQQPGAPPRPVPIPGQGRPPLDSTRAQKMLARRHPPTDVRVLRLEAPIEVGVHYVIRLDSVRGLTGAYAHSPRPVHIAPPPPSPIVGTAPGARDTTATDTTRVRPPPPDSARTDSTRAARAHP